MIWSKRERPAPPRPSTIDRAVNDSCAPFVALCVPIHPAIPSRMTAAASGASDARPLKRAIQAQLENPLAKLILEGKFGPKDVIPVDIRDGEFVFDRVVH